jgi:hypothetical protein
VFSIECPCHQEAFTTSFKKSIAVLSTRLLRGATCTHHILCWKMNDPGVKRPLSISVHLSTSNSILPRPKMGCSWGMYYGALSTLCNGPETCNLISSLLNAMGRLPSVCKRNQFFSVYLEFISNLTDSKICFVLCACLYSQTADGVSHRHVCRNAYTTKY